MTVTFLGQSGYVLKTERTEILIDPYLSESVFRAAGRPRLLPIPMDPGSVTCDGVVCTHNHLDHLDTDTVKEMKSTQLFITTNEGRAVLEQLGKINVQVLTEGKTVTVGDMELTAVFANHTVEAFGLIVKAQGKTLYFSGDTLYHEKLFDIASYKPDVAFICINGRLGNMNAAEALCVARKIGAKVNIPNHYDMFASNSEDPHLFADHIPGGRILKFRECYTV